ncbi:MAG: right-handed parallel beta-helix repeat-containing protein, partial [Chlamydiales bacterium]|nr:right-handed parallel beta-helix repeat-containing protein [Chlamydiales bacterium]
RTYNIIISPTDKAILGTDYVVKNNYIGTNIKGTKGFGERNGIGVWASQTTGLTIENNVISSNGKGIVVGSNGFGSLACDNTTIQHNIIGLDATGKSGLGNELHGVLVAFAKNTLISHNVISDNGGNGIQTGVAEHTTITHNNIGSDKEGRHRIGNGHNGIQLGTLVAAGIPSKDDIVQDNLIVGNHANGVEVRSRATNELIDHNCIIKNKENGVQVLCSDAIVTNNTIRDNGQSTVVIAGVVTSP